MGKKKKTLWEKEKLLVTSNFSFSHSVSKDLYCRHVKTRACLEKGKTHGEGKGKRTVISPILFDIQIQRPKKDNTTEIISVTTWNIVSVVVMWANSHWLREKIS